jgi:hypothetical protein
MKYSVEMGSGAHDVDTKFHKDWFSHLKVSSRDSQTHRQHGDRINPLLFYKIRKVG